MSLPVSRIVDVQISVSPLALQRAGFGIFNIVGISNVIPLSERVRSYNSITGVAADFATTTEEYLAAQVFFSQAPRPTTLYISRRAEANKPAQLVCGANAEKTIATWAAISDGAFDIDINGTEENITALDFSSVTDMDGVALVINARVATAFTGTCVLDSVNTRFIVTGSTTGSTATITFANAPATGTDVSGLMDALSTDGGTASNGIDAETITGSLEAIEALNSKWYGFGFTSEVKDGSITSAGTNKDCLDAGVWAEARIKLFCNNSADANTLVSSNTTNISHLLEQLEYNRTSTVYNVGDYPAVSMFAKGATVDFDGTDTTITYKFKQLPGISSTDLSATQANALIGFNCNYYTQFGTQLSGDAVSMLAEGIVANGRFLDEVVGIDWLQNAIQTDVFNYLFQNTTKVPQTNEGVSGIAQVLENVLAKAVTNGLAAPGSVVLDNETVFLDKGYLVFTTPVEDQSQASREAREAPPISFIVKGAGAIHSVTITGTFVR